MAPKQRIVTQCCCSHFWTLSLYATWAVIEQDCVAGAKHLAMHLSLALHVQITPRFPSHAHSHLHTHLNVPPTASPRQPSLALRSVPLGYPKEFRFVGASAQLEHLWLRWRRHLKQKQRQMTAELFVWLLGEQANCI